MSRSGSLASWVLVAVVGLLLIGAAGGRKVKDLPREYQAFLEEVEWLITKEERAAFLELEKDHQRDAFIRRFWEAREPTAGEGRPGFKERFRARREEALAQFKTKTDERVRIYTLNGEPSAILETDCGLVLWPIQIWTYRYSDHVGRGFTAIFYRPYGTGPFRLWRPAEGRGVLVAQQRRETFEEILWRDCAEISDAIEQLLLTIRQYEVAGSAGPTDATEPAKVHDPEWLATFHAFSTDVDESAEPLAAELDFSFAGRHQNRVIVRGNVAVPTAEAGFTDIEEIRSYNFQLTGEVLREEELFESFRYRFDLPVRSQPADAIPLVFQRYLRPGGYRVVIKLSDLNGGGVFREERDLEVPSFGDLELQLAVAEGEEGETEAPVAPATVELVSEGVELRSGMTRFSLHTTGEGIAKVRFLLDDKPVLTKTRPPYSVELDLGDLPVTHTVRAVALDSTGAEIATDEVLINPGEQSFVVRVVEPRSGEQYAGAVTARVEVDPPEGAALDRLELYLNEDRIATLYQEPYVQPITVEGGALSFLRVVAYLEDGNSTEDLVVFNSGDYFEDISVRLIELYATVLDRKGLPIHDLQREAFRILEEGQEQEIVRFEHLDDLPIYAGLLVDTSASMAPNLAEVQRVALGFFRETIGSKDRAAVITFSDKPRLAAAFTNEMTALAGALAGLTAERSTALYDSVLFTLYYFKGIKGQRAVIVLSDGEDRRSEATFQEALDFARSTGVTVYTISLEGRKSSRTSRQRLARLATETGGRAFTMTSIVELEGICDTIQADLRARYLLAYYPPQAEDDEFRSIAVKVSEPGAEVRTLSGYFP